jgi:predicted phosphoadenosine phosphosulfate sulfurtransferase
VPGRLKLGANVFDIALKRIVEQYEAGHRVVVSVSGGKDSGVCLELCIMAARLTGNLPVDACTRDEEIAYPGTYEYLERIHDRTDEVNLIWLVANQPIPNAFDRAAPYWWVFDPLLDPDEWVRKPPPYAIHHPELDIEAMVTATNFPLKEGQELRSILGLRAQESVGRLMGVHSSNGATAMSVFKPTGVRVVRPIYDWTDADIWLAHQKFDWDYNSAYDVMHRHGVKRGKLRIGPPTMNAAGGESLRQVGQIAWPDWWNRVCRRLPSVRTFAKYGKAALEPQRRLGETWEQCFQRLCVDPPTPEWIAERATWVRDKVVRVHGRHAVGQPLPEIKACRSCFGELGSWSNLTHSMYLGDPFSAHVSTLPYVEPEYFRPGAGYWGGAPGATPGRKPLTPAS